MDDEVPPVPGGLCLGEWVDCGTGDGTTMRVMSYRTFSDEDAVP